MTDTPPIVPGKTTMTEETAPSIPAADANGQLIVALAIVSVLGMASIGLIVAGCITGRWDVLGIPIGTAIGSLATALNAPTGITSALRASNAKKAGQ